VRPLDLLAAPDGRPITFRPAVEADREFLYRVYASTREDELAPLQWRSEVKEAFLRMQFAAQDAHYRRYFPGCEFLVILIAGRDAGRLFLDRREGEICVVDIALLPEQRGFGAGGAILRAVLAAARASNTPVTMHVERFNPALRLYQRLGFRQAADEGIYLRLEWRPAFEAANGGVAT
jgi:GNAT superfamily N-acetyltransferase